MNVAFFNWYTKMLRIIRTMVHEGLGQLTEADLRDKLAKIKKFPEFEDMTEFEKELMYIKHNIEDYIAPRFDEEGPVLVSKYNKRINCKYYFKRQNYKDVGYFDDPVPFKFSSIGRDKRISRED